MQNDRAHLYNDLMARYEKRDDYALRYQAAEEKQPKAEDEVTKSHNQK